MCVINVEPPWNPPGTPLEPPLFPPPGAPSSCVGFSRAGKLRASSTLTAACYVCTSTCTYTHQRLYDTILFCVLLFHVLARHHLSWPIFGTAHRRQTWTENVWQVVKKRWNLERLTHEPHFSLPPTFVLEVMAPPNYRHRNDFMAVCTTTQI